MRSLFSHGSFKPVLPASFALTILAFSVNATFAAEATPPVAGGPTEADTGDTAPAPMQQVILNSKRNSEAVSRATQELAPNIVNTVTQEEIRKLPDLNAGEAAGRLPGVSLSVDTGQGRWVNIRGLDADLTSTTYGGIHLPPTNPVTPQSGGRAFAFDTFPTGMIGSLTVTKTNQPAQDAEALGGTVEITPKAIPPGRDSFLEFHAGSGLQSTRSTGIIDLSMTGGLRFGGGDTQPDTGPGMHLSSYKDKPFSLVGSLTYYKDAGGTDDRRSSFVDKASAPNLAWSNMTQAYYQFHRTTKGAGAELAYQPDADTRLYARFLHSAYSEDVDRDRLVFKMTGTPTQNADGSITSGVGFDKSVRYMQENVTLDVLQLGGENKIGAAKIDYNIAHSRGMDYRPYDTIPTFSSRPAGATMTYSQADPNYPSYVLNGVANPLDPSTYKLSSVTNNTQAFVTKEWSGGTNVTLPTHFTSAADEELKFGAAVRLRTNSHSWAPYTSTAVPAGVTMDQAITGSPITYYNGHYANGNNISLDYMRQLWANGSGAGFATNPNANLFAAQAIQQDNKENVYAVYAQEHMTFGKLGILAGVRVETTKANYYGYASVPTSGQAAMAERGGQTVTSNGTTLLPVTASNSYTNAFPSLQARYEFAPDLIGRASFSSTIARPGFNQTTPAGTIDTGNFIVSQGNPNLKPTTSQNFDLSIERYLSNGGIASFGVFDKELSNYIVGRTTTATFSTTDPVYGMLGGNPTQVVSYANIAKARALGLELNYDQKYTMLPGWLSGLGTSFNYTYVDAKGAVRPGENMPLPSTSRNTYNASVYWENDKLNVRASTSYVGRNLLFVGSNASLDQYTESRLTADLSASYALTKNLSLYVSGRNLLNTAHTITEGSSNRIIQRETFGKTLLAGVNGSF